MEREREPGFRGLNRADMLDPSPAPRKTVVTDLGKNHGKCFLHYFLKFLLHYFSCTPIYYHGMTKLPFIVISELLISKDSLVILPA